MNTEIAEILNRIADLLDIKGVEWKPRAYRTAARVIESYPKDVSQLFNDRGLEGVEEIPGVGEGIGKKIVQYIQKGKIDEYDKLQKEMPKHVHVLMGITGMGPKKIRKLNEALGIKTVKQLEVAAKKGRIAEIEGFGDKSEQEILEGIHQLGKQVDRIPYVKAKKIADKIIALLEPMKEVLKISSAGSLRRKKNTIGDIDILVASRKGEAVIDKFVTMKDVARVLAKGPTKAAVVLKSGIQVDLRVLDPSSWGAGLFYFTGSKGYAIQMRKEAIKKGYKLNEYGLYDKDILVAGKTEQEICKKLGVKYLEPEDREF